MRPSTRYGLVGIGALTLLSLVDEIRDRQVQLDSIGAYLIGVAPNFSAAIAIIFVMLSAWADRNRSADFSDTRNAFLVCAAISGLGLIGWELVQKTSERFVFDIHDIFATLVGVGVSMLLLYKIAPRTDDDGETRRPDC